MKHKDLSLYQQLALIDLLWGSAKERNEISVKYRTEEGNIRIWNMNTKEVNFYHNEIIENIVITHILIHEKSQTNRLLRYLLRHKDILEKWLHNRGELHRKRTIGGDGANSAAYREMFNLDMDFGFRFSETPEGMNFWINIYDNAKRE